MEVVREENRTKPRKKVKLKSSSPCEDTEGQPSEANISASYKVSRAVSESLLSDAQTVLLTSEICSASRSKIDETSSEILCRSTSQTAERFQINNTIESKIHSSLQDITEGTNPSAPEFPEELTSAPVVTDLTQTATLVQGLELLKLRQGACSQSTVLESHKILANVESYPQSKHIDRVHEKPKEIKSEIMECWTSLEKARIMFGCQHLELAERCNKEFYEGTERYVQREELEFARLLEEFSDAMKMLYRKRSEVMLCESECEKQQALMWRTETREACSTGRCADSKHVELRAKYQVAIWNKQEAPRLRRRADDCINRVTSDLCVHQNTALVTKYNLEECLYTELTTEQRLRDGLTLLFSSLNTGATLVDLYTQLTRLAYAAVHALYSCIIPELALLLLLNHLVRQTRGIGWALPLIQVRVESTDDVQKVLAALSILLTGTCLHTDSTSDEGVEATEWTVVERCGAGLSERSATCSLSEQDMLGALHQLPLSATLQRLALLRPLFRKGEMRFDGDASGGRAALKCLCGAWQLAAIARQGLNLHTDYAAVCAWLCRVLALVAHTAVDLCAATRCDSIGELQASVSRGAEVVVVECWNALTECPHREMALAYAARMPFHALSETTLQQLHAQITEQISLNETEAEYWRLRCTMRMAECRQAGQFVDEVAASLYRAGFEASADSTRGAWARSLLALLLRRHSHLYQKILVDIARLALGDEKAIPSEWLRSLQLDLWRPTPDEFRAVLKEWSTLEALRILLPSLVQSSYRTVHHELGTRIVNIARTHYSSLPAPEWMFQVLVDLKLHAVDWQADLNAVPPPTDVSPEEQDPLICLWTVLATSWGHSLPLICEYGAALTARVARAGRCREATHALQLLLVVALQSPESIASTEGFKSLVDVLLGAGPSLTSRLLGRRTLTGVQMMQQVLTTHLVHTYKILQHDSPAALLQCWLQLLSCSKGWAGDARALGLLEQALACSERSADCARVAIHHFRELLQKPRGGGAWTVGKGAETPRVWLAMVSALHEAERASGLWGCVLWRLHRQRGSRISVDRAVEESGGGNSGEGLAIYRVVSAVLGCPASHAIFPRLCHLLIQLYLDRPLDSQSSNFSPVGALFFSGLFKSRVHSQLVRHLHESVAYHQDRVRQYRAPLSKQEVSSKGESSVKKARAALQYHELVLGRLRQYLAVLEDKPGAVEACVLSPLPIFENEIPLDVLASPLRSPVTLVSTPAAPVSPSDAAIEDDLIQFSPADRLVRRLQRLSEPLPPKEPDICRTALASNDSAGQLLRTIERTLDKLVEHAREFHVEACGVRAAECRTWELLSRLYEPRRFRASDDRRCGKDCTGSATLSVQGEEWVCSDGVSRELKQVRRAQKAASAALAAPRDRAARLCAALQRAVSIAEASGAAGAAFDCLARRADALNDAPPLRDALHALLLRLGHRHISRDATRCAMLVSSGGSSNLTGQLLNPALLPPRDFVAVYSAVLRRARALDSAAAPPHLIFSYLSKFDVTEWCVANPELGSARGELVHALIDALAASPHTSTGDTAMLLELLCRHLSCVAACAELGRCIELAHRAAAAGSLPPAVWPHLRAAIDSAADRHSVQELSEQLSRAGEHWWVARRRAAPACALDARASHAMPAAEVARAYTAALMRALCALHVEPDQRAAEAMRATLGWWSAWIQPDGGAPWGAGDDPLAEKMLGVFTDHLLEILTACPGGECTVLQHAAWWVGGAARWRGGGLLCKALMRLPWRNHPWFHVSCLPALLQLSSDEGEWSEASRVLVLQAVQNTNEWLPADLPLDQTSSSLRQLFRLLTDLPFSQKCVEDAVDSLPWEELNEDDLQTEMERYFHFFHPFKRPPQVQLNFPLLLAASGMHPRLSSRHRSGSARAKRSLLVTRWVRALGESVAMAGQIPEEDRSKAAEGAARMLIVIEDIIVADDDDGGTERCIELLSRATATLCGAPLSEIALPKWRMWARRAPERLAYAALHTVAHITASDCAITLAEDLLRRFLEVGGTWQAALGVEYGNVLSDAGTALRAGCPLAAYCSTLRACRVAPPAAAAVTLLDELQAVTLNPKDQEYCIVMMTCFLLRHLPLEDWEYAIEASPRKMAAGADEMAVASNMAPQWNALARWLQPWAEPSRFQFLRKLTLQTTDEASERLSMVCRVAVCVCCAARESTGSVPPADLQRYNATVAELSDIARNKAGSEVGATAGEYRTWLGDKTAVLGSRVTFVRLTSKLYPELATRLDIPE